MLLLNEAYRKILAVMAQRIANHVTVRYFFSAFGVIEQRVFYEVGRGYLFGIIPYKKHRELARITLTNVKYCKKVLAEQQRTLIGGLWFKGQHVNSNDELHVAFRVTDSRVENDIREIAREYRERSGEPTWFQSGKVFA